MISSFTNLYHPQIRFEMMRVDGCDCVKPKYRRGKQLFISGDVSHIPATNGAGYSLVISEASVGSFITPTESIRKRDILEHSDDCKIISRNLARTINVRKAVVDST